MENKDWNDREPLAQGVEALPEESFRFPQPSEELRMTVFNQTSKVVRARARKRRFIQVALVAAAYIGGITTAFLVAEIPIVDREGRATAQESLSGGEASQPSDRDFISDPGELERRSESAPPEERTRLLKEAGHVYLTAQYDVEKALHCYSRALDNMPASAQTIVEPDDTWLLAALKDSRR
jgi:hypothetical protein